MTTSGGGEDDTRAAKYALLRVPDHGAGAAGGLTSFVRLGGASTTWESDPGGDLARMAHDVGWSSEAAHEGGGVYSHTDGDRVSTTRGNKVNVVAGSYKAHVSRAPDDTDARPLQVSTHKLGVLEETHVRGEQYRTFDGPRYERIIGKPSAKALTPTYGSFSKPVASKATSARGGPSSGGAAGGGGAGGGDPTIDNTHNLVVVNETFAHEISAITAASGMITEVENAATITRQSAAAYALSEAAYGVQWTELQVGTSMENVLCLGTIAEQTHASTIHEITTAAVVMEAEQVLGLRSTEVIAGVVRENVQGAALSTLVGPSASLRIGDDITVALGTLTELALQAKLGVTVSAHLAVKLGLVMDLAAIAAFDISMGVKTKLHAGIHTELRQGPSLSYVSENQEEYYLGLGTGVWDNLKDIASMIFLGTPQFPPTTP